MAPLVFFTFHKERGSGVTGLHVSEINVDGIGKNRIAVNGLGRFSIFIGRERDRFDSMIDALVFLQESIRGGVNHGVKRTGSKATFPLVIDLGIGYRDTDGYGSLRYYLEVHKSGSRCFVNRETLNCIPGSGAQGGQEILDYKRGKGCVRVGQESRHENLASQDSLALSVLGSLDIDRRLTAARGLLSRCNLEWYSSCTRPSSFRSADGGIMVALNPEVEAYPVDIPTKVISLFNRRSEEAMVIVFTDSPVLASAVSRDHVFMVHHSGAVRVTELIEDDQDILEAWVRGHLDSALRAKGYEGKGDEDED